MAGARLDVQWSPVHPDKFITWGSEICLYETLPRKTAPKSACKYKKNISNNLPTLI